MSFEIDNIRSDDALRRARGEAFLAANPDPGVRFRPPDEMERAIATGQGLIVSEGKDIRGVSLVYQYDPGPGWPVAYEIGTMRVTASGHRLQAFLAQLHLVQIQLEDDATRGDVFAVVTPGTASEHNLVGHVGMTTFEPPEVVRVLRAAAGVPFDPAKRVLAAGAGTVRAAFAGLAALHLGDRRFRAPKGGDTIDIRMGWFDPALLGCGP